LEFLQIAFDDLGRFMESASQLIGSSQVGCRVPIGFETNEGEEFESSIAERLHGLDKLWAGCKPVGAFFEKEFSGCWI
jgi:hypothetical protein